MSPPALAVTSHLRLRFQLRLRLRTVPLRLHTVPLRLRLCASASAPSQRSNTFSLRPACRRGANEGVPISGLRTRAPGERCYKCGSRSTRARCRGVYAVQPKVATRQGLVRVEVARGSRDRGPGGARRATRRPAGVVEIVGNRGSGVGTGVAASDDSMLTITAYSTLTLHVHHDVQANGGTRETFDARDEQLRALQVQQ